MLVPVAELRERVATLLLAQRFEKEAPAGCSASRGDGDDTVVPRGFVEDDDVDIGE